MIAVWLDKSVLRFFVVLCVRFCLHNYYFVLAYFAFQLTYTFITNAKMLYGSYARCPIWWIAVLKPSTGHIIQQLGLTMLEQWNVLAMGIITNIKKNGNLQWSMWLIRELFWKLFYDVWHCESYNSLFNSLSMRLILNLKLYKCNNLI